MKSLDTDILIIGGGVAGSAMACSLKNKGYKVILVEKSDKPQDTARGDHIQPSVCEILERWNVLNDFIKAGAQKRAGSLWYDEHGNFLMDANVSKLNIPHPYFLYLNHENISEVLLDSVSSDKKFHMYRPILQCTHIESNENRSMFKLVLKDKTEYDIGADSYWYNSFRLKTIDSVHDYLESLDEAGKVVSISTTMDVLKTLNDGEEIDTFFLSLLYKKVPKDVKEALFDPYLSEDGNQLRISFRVFESYPDLQRNELIKKIKNIILLLKKKMRLKDIREKIMSVRKLQ